MVDKHILIEFEAIISDFKTNVENPKANGKPYLKNILGKFQKILTLLRTVPTTPKQTTVKTPTTSRNIKPNVPSKVVTPAFTNISNNGKEKATPISSIPKKKEPSKTENSNSSDSKISAPKKKLSGKVKSYNFRKCYGFIEYDDKEIFVHKSSIIKSKIQNKKHRTLCQHESVEFEISINKDGKSYATNVTGPNGTDVIGTEIGKITKIQAEKISHTIMKNLPLRINDNNNQQNISDSNTLCNDLNSKNENNENIRQKRKTFLNSTYRNIFRDARIETTKK